MRVVFNGIVYLSFVFLSGCASLTDAGRKVQIVYTEKSVEDCEFKGAVKAESKLWGGKGGEVMIETEFKNKAGALGANRVVTSSEGGRIDRVGTKYIGDAFYCAPH